jgi:hydroxymethylbilane synthase
LLSRAQIEELRPQLPFDVDPVWIETTGDLDQKTSLRSFGKTDFFTRELDQLLLEGSIRLAIHSAKDLPEPKVKGLFVAAVTNGLDPRDALVVCDSFDALPIGAWIATSSKRREDAVRSLRSDLRFKDLRGTIHQRLELLENGGADGIVVAEAALIRLHLIHLNRIYLPGNGSEGQGQLAILCREDDQEMIDLLACIKFST